MSFWSKLAKIGGWAAAPFTGGASVPIGNAVGGALDAFGKGAGAASQAQAYNRGTKAEIMMDQNSALERELLNRQENQRRARDHAYQNAQRGAMAVNYTPAQGPPGTNVVRFGGGAIGSPQARAAGDELVKQSMNRMTQPDLTVDGGGGMPAYRNLATDKDFTKTLNPGIMERLLGYGSAFSPLVKLLLERNQAGSAAPADYSDQLYGK